MLDSNQFLLAIGYCFFMLLLSLVFQKYLPKKINYFYGYRTSKSMKNQATWDAANKYSAAVFVRISYYSFLFPLLFYFLFSNYVLLITIIGNTLLLLSILYRTEIYLKKHFDEHGEPLQEMHL